MMNAERVTQEEALKALQRAQNSTSLHNDLLVIQEFAARGIPEDQIIPRENVLTFQAWIAKGRVVKKGEKGVRIPVLRRQVSKDDEEKVYRRFTTAIVFHESQTVELEEKNGHVQA